MEHHYVWLIWVIAFLFPWTVLYLLNPQLRQVMRRTSAATALFGLTEPIFVPVYWNPPSLFELARRTGFDIESLIFAFAIGGIGVALYHTLAGQHLVPVTADERAKPVHRFHPAALLVPLVLFVPFYFLPWNPIYAVIASLAVGAIALVVCRPDLWKKTVIGGFLFLGIYAVFMLSLVWLAPGYIRLNAIYRASDVPWKLSFSFGRALQAPALNIWKGIPNNVPAAQTALHHRAHFNSFAVQGKYSAQMETAATNS